MKFLIQYHFDDGRKWIRLERVGEKWVPAIMTQYGGRLSDFGAVNMVKGVYKRREGE